jgi:hypothetical protein
MNIHFQTSAITPMKEWLSLRKKKGYGDEASLRKILSLEDYAPEFARYGDKNLPVCRISYEEAVDFFLHFDQKKFTNQRLEYKRPSFIKFYDDLEKNDSLIKEYSSFGKKEEKEVEALLASSLPSSVSRDETFTVLLIISIGNSMGWPYMNLIDFDVANLSLIGNKESFIHILSHEIHHTQFMKLVKEGAVSPQENFLYSFAFEGLPIHYLNNAPTKYKAKKYPLEPSYAIDKKTWDFFSEEDEELFQKFKEDYKKTFSMNEEEVDKLLSHDYQSFYSTSLRSGETCKVAHYPTYYLGAFLFGSIDLAFSKEKVFSLLKDPSLFATTFNEAMKKLHLDSKFSL